MSEGFQVARLIPVSGIANASEAEVRATSALLSVLTIVRDLSLAVTSPLGSSSARRATVEAFIETRFKLGDSGAVVRPDGLIQVTYGSSTWRALVEVKTGDNDLEAEQVNNYLAVAREQGIDAVITLSNQIGVGGVHPCDGVKLRANSKVRLAHFSWTEILAFAVRAKVHRGVEDPEQAWILGELIRYLEHPSSGAMAFDDMGGNWVPVRDGAREGTLRRAGDDVREIVQRWEQLMRFAALKLGADIGVDVQHIVPKSQSEVKARTGYLTDLIVGSGGLDGTLRIPGAAGTVTIAADLRARQISATSEIAAPQDRGNKARATWLVRQLGPDTPNGVVIEAWPRHARQPLTATLAQAREDVSVLVDPEKRDTLRFRVVLRSEMGQHRKDGGRSPGFIQSVMALLRSLYRDVLQQVSPWVAPAPQTRAVAEPVELKQEPIEDEEDLDEAITAARDNVTERTGDQRLPAPDAQPEAGADGEPVADDEHDPIWDDDPHEEHPTDDEFVVAPTEGLHHDEPEGPALEIEQELAAPTPVLGSPAVLPPAANQD